MEDLHAAAQVVGDLMAAAVGELGEEIPETAAGYADRQVVRAASTAFAMLLFRRGNEAATR